MKRARPPPVAPQQEDGRLLEGELPATPGPALTPTARAHACAYTHTDTHSPCQFSFGLNQPHGIRAQVQGRGDMVTSLGSVTLETSGRAQDRGRGADILSLGQKRDPVSMGTNRTTAQGL